MGNDDDIIIRKKLAAIEEAGKKPVTLRLWVAVAIAIAAFLAGVWLG